MDAYAIAFFVHMLGLITLFGALILLQRVGARLRRVRQWEDARLLLSLMRPTRGMFIASGVFLLGSGLYMTASRWTFSTPWVVISLAGLLAFVVLSPFVIGRRLAAIGRVAAEQEGPISKPMRDQIADPRLWAWIFGMNLGAMAFVWLMTVKPGWIAAIGITVTMVAVGAMIGVAAARGYRAGEPRGERDTVRPRLRHLT